MGRLDEGEWLRASKLCYNVKRQLPSQEPVVEKKNLPDSVGGCCGWLRGSGRSSLAGAEAGPPRRGSREGLGRPPQVNPILRTGGGRNARRPLGAEAARGRARSPAANHRWGGDCGARLPRPGRGGPNPFPKIRERPALSTPFLPKNTFLAKSLEEEGDLFPGRTAGGVAAAPAPPERGPGRRGARAAPSLACPPSSRVSHSTAVAAAILRARREEEGGGGGRGRGE